jgi:hypothetical protein
MAGIATGTFLDEFGWYGDTRLFLPGPRLLIGARMEAATGRTRGDGSRA